MQLSILTTILLLLSSTFASELIPVNVETTPVTSFLAKRTFICTYFNTCNYQSDVYNCGYNYNVCPGGAVGYTPSCQYGRCTFVCALGYSYDYSTGSCRDVYTDVYNCGACGSACALTGAAYARCELGKCYASSCIAGYAFDASGVCQLTTNYLNDVNNCGTKGNVCPNSKLAYSVAACSNGVCGSQCSNSYDYDYNLGGCRNVANDVYNCGQCGTVCSLPGAATATCEAGTCYAATCLPGYQMGNYVCNQVVNTSTDVKNCGAILNICPTSYTNGVGSTCIAGVCQPVSCNTGFKYNFSTKSCQNVQSDLNNCGSVGNVCSFPRATGTCVAGICTLGACISGYTKVNNVCTAVNLTSDVNNCGAVGKVCSFTNGVGSCVASVCTITSCNSGYSLVNGVCTAINTQTDAKNCGAIGKACATSYLNGGAGVCIAGVCSTVCNAGFTFDATINGCRDILSDTYNCGSLSFICSISSGVSSCVAGTCGYSSCKAGFVQAGRTCTRVDTTSDVNNCGVVGKVCSTAANGSSVKCVNSLCVTTCNAGFAFDPIGLTCKQTSTDVNNCGSLGNVCQFPNSPAGTGKCIAGVCTVTVCSTGFQLVAGACVPMDLTSDSNNCGAIGKVCSFPNGIGSCLNSICTTTSCTTLGYLLVNNVCIKVDTTTDVNNCGAVGKKCPATYLNGGAGVCVNSQCTTTCNTGYSFDFTTSYCRNTATDIQNCGSIGFICSTIGTAPGALTCLAGICKASACATGYSLNSAGTCTKIDTTNDLNNCGTIGLKCSFIPLTSTGVIGATGLCQNSLCVVKVCPTGFTVPTSIVVGSSNACNKVLTPSSAPRFKKRDVLPRTLCPSGETACPISGSASFERARMDGFSSFRSTEVTEALSGGGYECMDTMTSLDSCGGCSSMGEGMNCLEIRGVNGVGCDQGNCIVFSCQSGYRPNLTGERCIRIHETSHSLNRSSHHVNRAMSHKSHIG